MLDSWVIMHVRVPGLYMESEQRLGLAVDSGEVSASETFREGIWTSETVNQTSESRYVNQAE